MGYNLGTAEGRIVIDGSGAEKGFSVASAAAEGFSRAVSAKADQIESFGKKLIGIGVAGTAGFGVAVNVAADFEYQLSAIAAVGGKAAASRMEDIRGKALQLGKDTAFSASEAALAMEELVKAGISVDDVLNGAADAAVALAAAGEIDLAQAAEIAASAMNNFNLEASELPGVVDAIAGAANASAIDVGQFNQSLQQVGAVANLAGFSFDDTAIAIAELGNAGIKGSDAGTSLKTMLMNLIPVTKQQKEEFARLGITTFDAEKAMYHLRKDGIVPASESLGDIESAVADYIQTSKGYKRGTEENAKATQDYIEDMDAMSNRFFDAEGKVRSLGEIQQILKETVGELGDEFFNTDGTMKSYAEVQDLIASGAGGMAAEQRLASLEIMFGSDAIRAAAVLANEGAEGYREMANAMGEVTATEVAATRMDNLRGTIEELKGTFETIMITIGTQVIPAVRWFLDGIKNLLNGFLELPEPVKKAIGIFLAVATVFSLVAGAATILLVHLPAILGKMLLFRTISTATRSITGFFGALRAGAGLRGAVTAMAGPWKGLASKIGGFVKIAKGAISIFGKLRAAIMWPVSALIAMGAYVIWAYNNLEGFRNTVDAVGQALVDFWNWFTNMLKPFGEWLSGEGSSAIDWFSARWQEALGWIKDNQYILEGIAYVFSGILIVQMLRLVGVIGVWVAKMIWGFVTSGAKAVWHGLVSMASAVRTAAAWALMAARAVWNALVIAAQYVMIGARAVATGLIMYAQSLKVVAAWVLMAAQSTWNAVKIAAAWALSAGTAAATAVASTVTTVASIVAQWVAMAVRAGAQALLVAGSWALTTGTAAATAVAGMAVAAASVVGGWLLMAGQAVLSAIIIAAQWIIAFWPIALIIVILIAVVAAVIIFWDDIVAAFKTAANWVADKIEWLWDRMVEIWDGIVETIREAVQWLRDIMQEGIDWIVDQWNTGVDMIIEIFNWLWEGLQQLVVWISEGVQEIIDFFVGLADGVWDAMQQAWDWIVEAWDGIIEFIGSIPGQIAGFFSSAISWLVGAGTNIVVGLWNGFANWVSNLWGNLQGFVSNFFSFFRDAGSWLLNVGRNIVTGLWNGIVNMASWLWDQISGWLDSIVDNVLGWFGISSPSKLFAGIGEYLVQGLAMGIDDESNTAIRAASRMAEAVTDGFDASLGDLGAMIDGAATLDVTAATRHQITSDMAGLTVDVAGISAGVRVPESREVQEYGTKVENNFISNVYNPVAEKASDSEARRQRTVAAMGSFGV